MNTFDIPKLKAAVKGLAAKGQAKQRHLTLLRRTRPPKGSPARADHGIAIQGVVAEKRSYGHCARYHHLAYAFVRGRPYRWTERRTRPGNEPNVGILLDVLTDFSTDGLEHVVASLVAGRDIPITVAALHSTIKAWLAEPAETRSAA